MSLSEDDIDTSLSHIQLSCLFPNKSAHSGLCNQIKINLKSNLTRVKITILELLPHTSAFVMSNINLCLKLTFLDYG